MSFATMVNIYICMFLGRVNSSSILTELVFSLSNLLVLFNDRIIAKSVAVRSSDSSDLNHNGHIVDQATEQNLKVFLTTLEYVEVFIELSAKKILGDKGRYFIIFIIQSIK